MQEAEIVLVGIHDDQTGYVERLGRAVRRALAVANDEPGAQAAADAERDKQAPYAEVDGGRSGQRRKTPSADELTRISETFDAAVCD